MHSLMSPASTIAVLVNPANIAQTATERATVQDAARALGVRVVILNASSPSEIESAFEVLVGQRVDALVVSGEIFFLPSVISWSGWRPAMQCQPYMRTASFRSPAVS